MCPDLLLIISHRGQRHRGDWLPRLHPGPGQGPTLQAVRPLPRQAAVPWGAESHTGQLGGIRLLGQIYFDLTNLILSQGDKAVVFPCSLFNVSTSDPDTIFCFKYISVARDGAVNTVNTRCLPVQETGNGEFVTKLYLVLTKFYQHHILAEWSSDHIKPFVFLRCERIKVFTELFVAPVV